MRGTKVKKFGRFSIVSSEYAGKITHTVVGARSRDFKTIKGAKKYIRRRGL